MTTTLHYTPVTLAPGDTIADVLAEAKTMPLYKRGDVRLIWANEVDLRKLERAGLAVQVERQP